VFVNFAVIYPTKLRKFAVVIGGVLRWLSG
jgi:hypothetical protein